MLINCNAAIVQVCLGWRLPMHWQFWLLAWSPALITWTPAGLLTWPAVRQALLISVVRIEVVVCIYLLHLVCMHFVLCQVQIGCSLTTWKALRHLMQVDTSHTRRNVWWRCLWLSALLTQRLPRHSTPLNLAKPLASTRFGCAYKRKQWWCALACLVWLWWRNLLVFPVCAVMQAGCSRCIWKRTHVYLVINVVVTFLV